ncbi:hypothetical protein C8T65DRAFT_103091 [Cerioporus squamosus]|nr:hypothetical protein C8T65DRAFT_103091 [Cerioporus squamosus]
MKRILVRSGLLLLFLLCVDIASSANTDCRSSELDWYTKYVGETPCMSFQRLLQICDNSYQVPLMTSAPGTTCSQSIPYCCCNSIAYGLSILCANCQLDNPGDSHNGGESWLLRTVSRQVLSVPERHHRPYGTRWDL